MAAPEEGCDGAAGSPLAGERIPREGECAAVERFHRDALSFSPLRRRCGRGPTSMLLIVSVIPRERQGDGGGGGSSGGGRSHW
jgi:hypothetical protein